MDWLARDEMNSFRFAKVRGDNFVECVTKLAGQACAVYPTSDFAEAFRQRL